MSLIHFACDYGTACHPSVLAAMAALGTEQFPGYGLDRRCDAARQRIRELIRAPDADVHLMVGGTHTNSTAITFLLKPWECVIADAAGHISVHETGAVEACGHKVITVPSRDGKLTPAAVQRVVDEHTSEHMLVPKLVYISNTTELGTLYSKAEMTAISEVCRANDLILFLDGARIFSALTSSACDFTLPEVARLVDAFYIGGTKCGALFGEALIFVSPRVRENSAHFRHLMKQRGTMLAKGYLLGVQFEALFADNLAWDLAAHANKLGAMINDGVKACGCDLPYGDSYTNQVFFTVDNDVLAEMKKRYTFHADVPASKTSTIVRFVTSWCTTEEDCKLFLEDLKRLTAK